MVNWLEDEGVQMYWGLELGDIQIFKSLEPSVLQIGHGLVMGSISCLSDLSNLWYMEREYFRWFGFFGGGLKDEINGIQPVVQIEKFEDFETWRQVLARIRGLLFRRPFQTHEADDTVGEERKFPYLIYLSWSCLTQGLLKFVNIFQPSLAIRATFISCMRWNPKPPWFRGGR